ncbi:MAG: TetR/AcrR family transcriptional regulator [Paenibacillus sp.]|jgi:AcrR family transcriptional regulator|nr:TetR/AcrR family transcriptional regulator [Paenibacillus sp.]
MKDDVQRARGRPKHSEQDPSIRDQILRTASALFMEKGYDNVSLEHIAQACGVTKAMVYYYYTNKATLFTTAVVQMMKSIRYYTKLILDREGPLQDRLKNVAEAYLKTSHFDFESLMREAGPTLTKQQASEMREAERSIHLEVAEAFQQAMDRQEINHVNSLLAAHTFSAAMMIRNRKELGLAGHPSDAAEEIVNLFWIGLLPRN